MKFRCSIDFNIVAEPKYKEDCHVDVEHICEDYVHIPYPEKPDYGLPPPPTPNDSYGPPVPPPHHHSDEPISDSYGTSKPYNSPTDVYGTPKAPPILSESYAAVPETTGSLSNSYGLPLASSLAGNHHFSTADVNILAAQLFSRTKRNAQREDFAEVQMRELLTTAIMQKMTTTTDEDLFKNLSEMFSSRAKQMKQAGDDGPEEEPDLGIVATYKVIWKIICHPLVPPLVLFLFTSGIGFTASETITNLRLISAGTSHFSILI